MFKTTINTNTPTDIPVGDMKPGQIGIVTAVGSSHFSYVVGQPAFAYGGGEKASGVVFMATKDGTVPYCSRTDLAGWRVRLLRPGESVTLEPLA
jgi:hypothetical protein